MTLESINPADFEAVLKQHPLVFVVFSAVWCGNCGIMKPIYTNLAENHSKEASFAQIDAQNAQNLTEQYGIMDLPVALIFKDGQLIKRLDGIMSGKRLEEEMAGIL